MKKIKNISHARIAEHMKQLKNAELPEHAGTAEHFRNEWKYLISTSEKELLDSYETFTEKRSIMLQMGAI